MGTSAQIEREKRSPRSGRRRFALGGTLAVLIHGALFAGALSLSREGKDPAAMPEVELQIVTAKTDAPSRFSTSRDARPVAAPRRATRTSVQSSVSDEAVGDSVLAQAPGTAAPSALGAGSFSLDSPDGGLSAPKAGQKLALGMDWSGFDAVFGEGAKEAREAYDAELDRKRTAPPKSRRASRLVLAAMGDNRPFGPLVTAVKEEERVFAGRYLAALSQRITPRFNDFLLSVMSLGQRLHTQIQNSPMRYNPLYVPPPPGELDGAPSTLNAVFRQATAQFALSSRGVLEKVKLVRTSGAAFFDAAALTSLYDAGPFPAPPEVLLSADARAYFEWGFDKRYEKNGPSNARHLVVMAVPAGDTGRLSAPPAPSPAVAAEPPAPRAPMGDAPAAPRSLELEGPPAPTP